MKLIIVTLFTIVLSSSAQAINLNCQKSSDPKDLNVEIEGFCVIFSGKALP